MAGTIRCDIRLEQKWSKVEPKWNKSGTKVEQKRSKVEQSGTMPTEQVVDDG